MKKFIFTFFILVVAATSFAQTPVKQKIALFTPLYLDSAFDASFNYRFNKSFPKFLNPGLEFYQGAQLALDSLQKDNAPLEVFIYDSRSKRSPIKQQILMPEFKDVQMIIAYASSSDVRTLAEVAQRMKVPFISATLPNDGGVVNNPYLVVLNSTLLTHCEGIYAYLQKYHSQDKIIMFRKNGLQETQIKNNFTNLTKSITSTPLKIEFVDIGVGFDEKELTSHFDSNKRNVCIVGSLDESFGKGVVELVAAASTTFNTTVIGMPTWEDMNFSKSDFKDLEIVYTTPFYYNRNSSLASKITASFESEIKGRPTDMFYRGYEVMLRFALLLLDTKKDVASNLSRKGNYVFTQFDIQPVFLNKSVMTLDYFENKKLYFVKYINGIKAVVN